MTASEPGQLLLHDGLEVTGSIAGAPLPVEGEVVFNTAMSGYPETLTDPSYAGQILVLTYPLVGNYGVPPVGSPGSEGGRLQSRRIQIAGLVIQRLAAQHSHFLAAQSLSEWCAGHGVPILHGVDTRTLTRRLREHGTMRGWLYPATLDRDAAQAEARSVEMSSEVFRSVAPPCQPPRGLGLVHTSSHPLVWGMWG